MKASASARGLDVDFTGWMHHQVRLHQERMFDVLRCLLVLHGAGR